MKNLKNIFTSLKSPRTLRILAIVLLILILSGGVFYYKKTENRIFIENAFISAQLIPIAPTTPGNLNKLYVFEGEAIKKGDPIADVGGQTIRASSDALIVKAQKVAGSIISLQNPVVSLILVSDLRVDGIIDENKGLNKIRIGQPVSFTIDAFPGKAYWGFVDEISPTAKQTQLAFSVSSERPIQQFEVFAKFDPALYPELKNGMSAKIVVYVKNVSAL